MVMGSPTSGGKHRYHRTRLVHKAPRKADDVRSEINVTPLVDVCLVLLIIFMVVMPMLTRGKEVHLPDANNAEEKKDTGKQPIVSVVKDGAYERYYFNQDPEKNLDDLKKAVEADLAKKGGERVFVKADVDLTYSQVYPVLIAIQEAGSPGVELGTTVPKKGD